MLIPTIIIFLMVFFYMFGNISTNLNTETKNSLLISNNNLDLIISNAVYQHNLMMTNPAFVLSLKKLLDQDEINYNDLGFLKSLKTILMSIAESHEYVDSIYLYLDGYNKFLNCTTGVEPIDTFYDNSWYKNINLPNHVTKEMDYWVESRSVKKTSFSEEKEYITLYRRMAYIDGMIVINIDKVKFAKILNTIFNNKDTSIFMLNSKLDILASNNIGDSKSETFKKDLINLLKEKDINNKWVKLDGENNLVNSTVYSDYALKIVALVSNKALWKQLETIIKILVSIFLVNCLVVIMLTYIVTKRNFDQISFIIDTFDKAELGVYPETNELNREKDEYALIMNNIVKMFINTTYLNSQLEQKQYKEKVAELTALQTQINPHFLFNTLQTLSFEFLKFKNSNKSNAIAIIQGLSDLLKYALMPSMEKVTLQQEVLYLKKYVEIQKYRFSNKLVVYYQIEDDIQDYPVFRLVLQPIVENSILHGVRFKEDKGYIKLKIFHNCSYLSFHVIDNGVGIDKQEIEELYHRINDGNGMRIGLANVNQRLKLNYGETCSVRILSKKGFGTSISFNIPYDKGYVKRRNSLTNGAFI